MACEIGVIVFSIVLVKMALVPVRVYLSEKFARKSNQIDGFFFQVLSRGYALVLSLT